ncbi:type II toxin-antitoxin system SpoIISA family toxin [Bacillus subtilis]|uniref:type II toxin-antitoxin system SpoIISA family toxin n=1 Tax=Bacillus subtilis TaxID=1423 RepID=UPI00203EF00E|nr:type II toxin-antitoxin system SpoIISA family toxin [Bacillus subtilis]MCM3188900.1 type II toxin-antitoxin system SpoIISA family toxin [Bacillus subtilis]
MIVNSQTVTVLSVLLLILVASIGLYIINRDFYLKNRVALRKIYYGLIIIAAFILWVLNAFPFNNIPVLSALVVSVVVIDLFIFQTPDVTKFMSNEFKQEELVETINKNRGTFIDLSQKLIKINEFMPKKGQRWVIDEIDEFDFSVAKYEEFALSYLSTFTSDFGMDIYSYIVESAEDDNEFLDNIKDTYKEIKKEHGFTLRGLGMRESQAIKTLSKGENIEIIDKDSSSVLFPYFGEYYNLLYVVSSKKGDVTGADASLLLNMLYTLDLWLIYNEDDIITEYENENDENDRT